MIVIHGSQELYICSICFLSLFKQFVSLFVRQASIFICLVRISHASSLDPNYHTATATAFLPPAERCHGGPICPAPLGMPHFFRHF
jgi:hypothetical protein